MARPRTGQLIKRASGWYARIWTMIDGEWVRVMRALGTHSKAAAKAKLARMLAADGLDELDPKRADTFREAAERVYEARIADASEKRGQRNEIASLRRYAFDLIGDASVKDIEPTDINEVLDSGKHAGLGQQSVQHLRQRISNVFAALVREGTLTSNPVDSASMPKFPKAVQRERAVLTDEELAIYLGWQHPQEGRRAAVRERQTMACIARMFGGLRTGDLHALRWEAFDTEGGAFSWGYAPRQKTRRPQLLEVPAMLRPILKDWWERAGRPSEGFLFPVRRARRAGADRVGEERKRVSHAHAFRRDLQRAFIAAGEHGIQAPAKDGRRWRELFTETDFTMPVDFHSWRRAFVQALADADVNAQQAAALAGHASLAAHARYLRSSGKLRALPAAALPDLHVLPAVAADEVAQKALAKGSARDSDRVPVSYEQSEVTKTPRKPGANAADSLRRLLLYPAELRAR